MARKDRPIDSFRDLQRLAPAIVKAINADQALALRAAANPLLALEELGYELTPELRLETERRVRFAPQTAEELTKLADAVFAHADERFDLDAPAELERVLFEKLKLPRQDDRPAPKGARAAKAAPATQLLPAPSFTRRPFADPLERLRDAHPVMAPLLAYRKLEASEPRLAPRPLYEKIKNGEVALPATRIQVRLQRGPTPE